MDNRYLKRGTAARQLGGVVLLAVVLATVVVLAKGDAVDDAKQSAESWLTLVDNGQFDESWDIAGEYLQHANTKEVWVRKLDVMRKPLGAVVSRTLTSSKYDKGDQIFKTERVRLKFQTSFANKASAIETLTSGLQKDGSWKVSGYYIQ